MNIANRSEFRSLRFFLLLALLLAAPMPAAQGPAVASLPENLQEPGGSTVFQEAADKLSQLTLEVADRSALVDDMRLIGGRLDSLRTSLHPGARLPAEYLAPLRVFIAGARQAVNRRDTKIIPELVTTLDQDVKLMIEARDAAGPKYAGESGLPTEVEVTVRTFSKSSGVEVGGYQIRANPRYRETNSPEAYSWTPTDPKRPPMKKVVVGAKMFWAVKDDGIVGTPVVYGVGGSLKMDVRLDVP